MISDLIGCPGYDEKPAIIEEICALITSALRKEKLSDSDSDFLRDHAYRIHDRIEDPLLRARFSIVN